MKKTDQTTQHTAYTTINLEIKQRQTKMSDVFDSEKIHKQIGGIN